MKLLSLLLALWVQSVAVQASSELIDRATVYIQPVSTVETPARPLVEIEYNPSTLQAELVSFEAPELSLENKLVRIGIYDASTSTWKSSTTITSVESFNKGYAPTFVLSLDSQGDILGVACKSGKIDAGQTRDFGPKVKVLKSGKGKQPELNRPVILSPEGKLEQPVPEKTMLQKYWWVALGLLMLVMTSGGGGE